MEIDEIHNTILTTLGLDGRMISGSKSGYRSKYPDHLVIFNANVLVKIDKDFKKLWHGDVDITLDENALRSVALDTGCELCVLYEMDGRFEFEDNPKVDKYVFWTDGIDSDIPEDEYNKFTRNENKQIVVRVTK